LGCFSISKYGFSFLYLSPSRMYLTLLSRVL